MRWRTDAGDRRRGRSAAWHPWFAWHPVQIGNLCVWGEWVERRGGFDHSKNRAFSTAPWLWEYRTIEEKAA